MKIKTIEISSIFQFTSRTGNPAVDIQQLFQESARTILRPLRLLQIMATDYYIVGNLRKDYEESYSKLGHRWKDYVQRKYDIIDKVQKDGLLLVGINPSFDESFQCPCEGEVRDSENGGYQHPYFSKPKKLNEEIGISSFSHVDMLSVRSRLQHVVQDIVNDPDSQEFVEEQLRLFRMIVDGASPRAIVVVNALASHLIRMGRALGALDYDDVLGVAMYKIGEKRVPVFYSGMLSGAHAIDNGSFDRLIWHIKYVLNMQSENSSQLRVNS